MSLLIRGGRVLDPARELDQQADLLIEKGRVARIARGIAGAERVIDAQDKLVIPGLVDLNARLREPGEEYKEDLASGGRAAAAGGFTRLCVSADTHPINDRRSVTEHILKRSEESAPVHIHPVGALTLGAEGTKLCEYADMQSAGVVALGDPDRSVTDSGLMRRALEYASTFDLPVFAHCEDHSLSAGGVINEGLVSTQTGLPGRPAEAESIGVARDLALVELTGARWHLRHITTASALDQIRDAKARGLPVTCEVSALHLALSEDACLDYETSTKVFPPFRRRDDMEALRAGLAAGVIDVIVSDHAPQSVMEKELEFGLAGFGASTLETTLALALDLWRSDKIPIQQIIAALTCNPARIAGIPGGTLAEGCVADITIVDPEATWRVEGEAFISKGKSTPLEGKVLRGAAVATLVAGGLVYEQCP
ncbi:MAG: dihydroorotase [Deltaproteobacteria bacterium]|nr:dihydroorotase [Deltaproteobacteria bacterium]